MNGPHTFIDPTCEPEAPSAIHQRARPVDDRTLGGWQLVELAGEGQFSSVYLGRPQECGDGPCDYAIKTLRSEFADDVDAIARLRQEAVIGISVEHKNLATVLSAHFDADPSYVVMPRLRGVTLSHLLRERGAFDVPTALWITRQAASALTALHQAGWVHADVKPENLFVAPDGHVTLFDFGLSLSVPDGRPIDESLRGTIAYAAPEAFTSRHGVCPASDTYSLGVVLYEMLSGHVPFQGEPADLVAAHVNQLPVSLRTHSKRVPKEVAQLVRLMLSKSPDRRPTCNEELQRRLTRLEIDQFNHRSAA